MPLLVLYDGSCGLCTGAAAWLARRDRRGALLLSPLGSAEGAPYRAAAFTSGDTVRPDTLVVVERAGGREVVRVRTDAVASALRALGLPWSLAGLALRAAPRRLADAAYRAVARRRRNKA
jgi:predicted DCC family thiol-disulfide oxidoreductase YuxK